MDFDHAVVLRELPPPYPLGEEDMRVKRTHKVVRNEKHPCFPNKN